MEPKELLTQYLNNLNKLQLKKELEKSKDSKEFNPDSFYMSPQIGIVSSYALENKLSPEEAAKIPFNNYNEVFKWASGLDEKQLYAERDRLEDFKLFPVKTLRKLNSKHKRCKSLIQSINEAVKIPFLMDSTNSFIFGEITDVNQKKVMQNPLSHSFYEGYNDFGVYCWLNDTKIVKEDAIKFFNSYAKELGNVKNLHPLHRWGLNIFNKVPSEDYINALSDFIWLHEEGHQKLEKQDKENFKFLEGKRSLFLSVLDFEPIFREPLADLYALENLKSDNPELYKNVIASHLSLTAGVKNDKDCLLDSYRLPTLYALASSSNPKDSITGFLEDVYCSFGNEKLINSSKKTMAKMLMQKIAND